MGGGVVNIPTHKLGRAKPFWNLLVQLCTPLFMPFDCFCPERIFDWPPSTVFILCGRHASSNARVAM